MMQIEKKGTELYGRRKKLKNDPGRDVFLGLVRPCPRLQSAGVLFRLIFFDCSSILTKFRGLSCIVSPVFVRYFTC